MHSDCEEGLVLWDLSFGVFINNMVSVQMTGKCDVCGRFHIWCWDCGGKYTLEKEDEFQCNCKGSWFWLTSIEPEEDGSQGNYLILVLGNGEYKIIDRKSL